MVPEDPSHVADPQQVSIPQRNFATRLAADLAGHSGEAGRASDQLREIAMSETPSPPDDALKNVILALLDENRIMCLATLRPDGWPQATMVGYAHDDMALYFAVGRTSQKLSNIQHDPRVSIAIGHDTPKRIRGLSMAARVTEVTDFEEVGRLNAILHARYPEQAVFAPREASSALLKATPKLVSIVDLTKGPGKPQLVTLESETLVRPAKEGGSEIPPGVGPPGALG